MKIPVYAPKTLNDIGCNGRIKRFPDGSFELLVCDRPIFGLSGWEEINPRKKSGKRGNKATDESIERSVRRARQQIRDYALCSDFDLFVTLTLDKKKIDRYDMCAIVKRLNVWLDNNVRRRGLKYILVPERHKDGAIHFHGFFNDVLSRVDSGHKDNARHTIYNLPNWTLGFSTAIELYGEYSHAVNYVCKYVGKSAEKIGGRWYYSGGNLNEPSISYANIDIADLEKEYGGKCFVFNVPGKKMAVVNGIKEE
jgi:hypothetical protein